MEPTWVAAAVSAEGESDSSVVVKSTRFQGDGDDDQFDNSPGNTSEQSGNKTRRRKSPGKWFLKCPRCWALLLGVILPLWFLIAVSFAFGYGLAVLESDPELGRNDEILRNQTMALFQSASFSGATQRLPLMCFEAYVSNETIDDVASKLVIDLLPESLQGDDVSFDEDFVEALIADTASQDITAFPELNQTQPNSTLDFMQVFNFIHECTSSSGPYIRRLTDRVTQAASIMLSTSDLTFYWNRCPLKDNSTMQNRTTLNGVLEDSVVFQGISSAYRRNLQPVSAKNSSLINLTMPRLNFLFCDVYRPPKVRNIDMTGTETHSCYTSRS